MPNLADAYSVSKKSLPDLRRIFLPVDGDVASPDFHYEWSSDLLNPRTDGLQHICYQGFRESGKTSIILRTFPLYALLYPRDEWEYIVIIKSNQGQARKALKNITKEYMTNPALNVHRRKVHKNTSDIFDIELHDGVKRRRVLIEVYGKGANIRGLNDRDKRPSIIILDDIQDVEDLRSELVPENDWDWFLSDVMFLGKSARIFMIGNNLGERCVSERVSRRASELGFKFKRIPCANEDLTVPTWACRDSIEDIVKERADFDAVGKLDIWLREKMCMAVNEATRIFNDEDYRHYPSVLRDRIVSDGEIIAALDPASSKRKDSCFRAIVVGCYMRDGSWYIIDVPYGRWDSIELMDVMFDVVRKWGVRDFGIEKGQYQQFLEPVLYREMIMRNLRFNVEPLEHGKIGGKLDRIKMLQPYFKSGSIWFPDEANWLTEMKSELSGVTRDDIKSEFIDLVDALAMAITQMRKDSVPVIETRKDPYSFDVADDDYCFNSMTC